MVNVEYQSITKQYGDTVAVDDINVAVEDGEFAILLGPSGCGKTTTLRCLAGLTKPTQGKINIGDHDVTDVHPKNRDIAMVFQNFALYPHMDVEENIGYPLKVAGVDSGEREERVKDTVEMLEIPELLDRNVDQLSGGQRQRVALGRALIRRPSVFLMDEPLASLDAKLKISMRSEIKVLQKELGITTLYVTHDQEEAMTLGDKLIIMNDGNIQQIGSPNAVYHKPANRFVAGFIGSPSMNFIDVRVNGHTVHSPTVDAFEYRLDDSVAEQYSSYDQFILGIRPKYFEASIDPSDNAIESTVEVTEPLGDKQNIDVVIGDRDDEHIELTIEASNNLEVERDDTIWLTLQDNLVHGFDQNSGERIIGESEQQQQTSQSLERSQAD